MKMFHRFLLWVFTAMFAVEPFVVYAQEELYRVHDAFSDLNETFEDYESAEGFFEAEKDNYRNLVLTLNEEVLKMEYGIVEFRNDEACSILTEYESIYRSEKEYLNSCYGADAVYIETDRNGDVVFMMAGEKGRIEKDKVILHPDNEIDGRISSYTVRDGDLIHNIRTQFLYDFYTYSLKIDEALPYLEENKEYYSADGHFFYEDLEMLNEDLRNDVHDHAVNEEAYYSYFRYLPFRSYTSYEAEDFRKLLEETYGFDGRLSHYEDLDGDHAADEINRSELYGSYDEYFALQSIYGTNALMLLGSAVYESSYGKSLSSFVDNNLYQATVYESDEERNNDRYDCIADSIYAHAKYFISSRYSNHLRSDYRGTCYGDRAGGYGINYSIDPYFGEKSASFCFELDRKMGSKDKDSYALAIVSKQDVLTLYRDEDLSYMRLRLYDVDALSFIVLKEYEDAYKVRIDQSFNDEYRYDPTSSVAFLPKDRVFCLINEEKIEDEDFDVMHYDFEEGNYHGLKSADAYLKKGKSVRILPEREGFDFVSYEDEKAKYLKIAKIDLKGQLKDRLLPQTQIDLREMELEVGYEDHTNKLISLNTDMIHPYDEDLLGKQDLIIDYRGLTLSRQIEFSDQLLRSYEQLETAIGKNDAEKVKELMSEVEHPLNFAQIRQLDYILKEKNRRNYLIFDRTERYDLSISGLDLSLADKRSLSIYGDTYYVIVEEIDRAKEDRIFDIAEGYGFEKVEGIDISFRFNYRSIELNGPAIVQLDIRDKRNDLVYSVYHLSEEGDVIKCRTTQSENYIQFMIYESGSYLVMSLPSANTYKIIDQTEDLSYENMGYDKHKMNFELMGTLVISLLGLIGITVYYILYNERKRMWKDFRRSLHQEGIVPEEKPKS